MVGGLILGRLESYQVFRIRRSLECRAVSQYNDSNVLVVQLPARRCELYDTRADLSGLRQTFKTDF